MKIAYLIYAHTHPEQLARMIAALDDPCVDFFIHIDKKVDIRPFLQFMNRSANIHVLKKRIKVFWMGYSMVEATLAMMRDAVRYSEEIGEPFKYYVLLSGQDYPIKSNQRILDFFERSEGTEYMLYWKLSEFWDPWMHKIEKYHYLDSRLTNQKCSVRYGWRSYRMVHKALHRIISKREYLQGIIAYGGSSWWMLTQNAVEYVLNYVATNRKFVNFYRFTEAPDEMFFHSIILNSPFADRVINYSGYHELLEKWKNIIKKCTSDLLRYEAGKSIILDHHSFNFRYIDWDPGRERPAILKDDDYNALRESECLYARKMHPVKSGRLLEKIDKNLRMIA